MVAMPTLSQSLATPTRFMQLSARLLPWIAGVACVLLAVGLYMSFTAPLDYQQGHAAKIMFVHVPAAWLSMFGYALVALSSFGSEAFLPSFLMLCAISLAALVLSPLAAAAALRFQLQ